MMFLKKRGQSECKVTIDLQVKRQTEGSVLQSRIHGPAVKRLALCRRRDYFVIAWVASALTDTLHAVQMLTLLTLENT